MLDASGLPAKWWPHAFSYAVFLYNTKQQASLKDDPTYAGQTPMQILLHSTTPLVYRRLVFGQLCFVSPHDKATAMKGTKFLKDAAYKCAFLTYEFTSDWHHPVAILLNLDSGKVLRSTDFTPFQNRYGYNLKPIFTEGAFGNIATTTLLPSRNTQSSSSPEIPFHLFLQNQN